MPTDLLERQTQQRSAIHDQALSSAFGSWDSFEHIDAESEVDKLLAQLFPVVEAAQVATGHVTASYVTGVVATLTGSSAAPVALAASAVTSLRQVSPLIVYRRPITATLVALAGGATFLAAKKIGRDRLERLVSDDLSMAHREAARRTFLDDDRITGYRRVVRPELGAKTCGLCIAASDNRYSRDDLLPIHTRCSCEVMPIVRTGAGKVKDPGRVINGQDIESLYNSSVAATGGSTSYDDLLATKFAVHHHGELGPVLRPAGEHFTGPAAIPDAPGAQPTTPPGGTS